MYNEIVDRIFLEKIQSADTICVFAHHYPDGDCVGCEMGLKKVLSMNFPDKKIYALGENSSKWSEVFGKTDIVDDGTVANSLAIVVDHNSVFRSGDPRVATCRDGIRFDHHLGEHGLYSFPAIVDVDAVSASQVILEFLLRCGLTIPKEAINDFLIAFMDDKKQYAENNMPARAKEIEELFHSLGANFPLAYECVHSKSKKQIAYEEKIMQKCQIFDDIAVAIMKKEDYESIGYPYPEAGSKSDYLLSLQNVSVALLFTYSDHEIRLSARSRTDFSVQALCSYFGGGGHLQAAGATFDTGFPIESVILKTQEMLRRM